MKGRRGERLQRVAAAAGSSRDRWKSPEKIAILFSRPRSPAALKHEQRRRILPRGSAKLSMSRLPRRTTAFIVLRSDMLNAHGRRLRFWALASLCLRFRGFWAVASSPHANEMTANGISTENFVNSILSSCHRMSWDF